MCNAGYAPLLDRSNSTYEYMGEANDNVKKSYPFNWGYVAEVNGTPVTRGEFRLWEIMQNSHIIKANPNMDFRALRESIHNKEKY